MSKHKCIPSKRNLVRQGDTIIAVESAPAVIDFQDILDATEVVYDGCMSEAPWDHCDGLEHTCTPAWQIRFDPSNMRGYCYCDRHLERVVIQLPADRDCWGIAAYARARGASKQVAAELAAANRRKTLDQLIKWYSDGWRWFGVKCQFEVLNEEFNDSLWGIDNKDYAEREIRPEIADNVADQLEKVGFTVTGRPKRVYPTREGKIERLRYNLQSQNWSD